MAKKKAKKRVLKHTPPKSNYNLDKWKAVPLKGSFMATAILGFLISAYWVYPQSSSYGTAFMLVFTAMFIAALISMTHAPVIKE